MLRGRHTGGRIFGYDNVSLGDDQGVVLAINDSEAAIVRRIFQMSADGVSPQKLSLGRGRYWGESVSELFGFGLEVLDL